MKSLFLCNVIVMLAAIWMLAASFDGQSGNGREDREMHLVPRSQPGQLGTEAAPIENERVSSLLFRFLDHANPALRRSIYVDPFHEEPRKAGEKFKIELVRKRGNNEATG
jgi:hypothetical protein